MKVVVSNFLLVFVIVVMVVFASGCMEPRYYHEHHEHSDRYYHQHPHRHRAGLDINIHN